MTPADRERIAAAAESYGLGHDTDHHTGLCPSPCLRNEKEHIAYFAVLRAIALNEAASGEMVEGTLISDMDQAAIVGKSAAGTAREEVVAYSAISATLNFLRGRRP